ncbi:MAG: carboxymuconolactone decarboxylase family protein [Pseudochelatococcus sp.]|uniref:carboxymuconolactone decarboxylase family protein n=1 Tax=Pseudochelatococcus sp. TaxID=2020869 RepID=UPI003D8BBB3A
MTHFEPIDDDRWPEEAEALRGSFATQLNVYRTMAHHPRLLLAWAPLRDHVVVRNALGRQFSEVVILRTGHRLDAAYEWSHHVSRGRACGMSDRRIASIAGSPEEMEEADGTLAQAVDDLVLRHALQPATREKVEGLVGVEGLFDLIATVGFYMSLGFIVKSFDTPVDATVAAELAARPLRPERETHSRA